MHAIDKPIRLSGHARSQLRFRGATEEEVIDAIRTAAWKAAEQGRLECRKGFPFDGIWNGKRNALKQVRPIFVDEEREVVVITVYVYYS